MNFLEYKSTLLKTLRDDSLIDGTDTESAFLLHVLDVLNDYDQLSNPNLVGMGDKKGKNGRLMRVDGYCIDEVDKSLILIISDFQDSLNTDLLTPSRLDELYWRLYYFLDEACNGRLSDYFDESDSILDFASFVKEKITAKSEDENQILKIKFLVITNKELDVKLLNSDLLGSKSKSKKVKQREFNEKRLEIDLWPLDRVFELESRNQPEKVVINVKDYYLNSSYEGIPCLKGNVGTNLGYEAYIAIIPGDMLAQIYIDKGSKILEGNVRAFLGAGNSKSVNSGIKRTINNEPTKFFIYNNGIAATAEKVELKNKNGELLITKIEDLQIINGGQTTASLAEAVLKRTNTSLQGIYVPMKLTVIENRDESNNDGVSFYDEMVQNIANYANNQNKVTSADLFSNGPFHIWMEKQSKITLAPPSINNIPTGWYYERARKKYVQEQFKLKGTDLKRFLSKYPKKQIISKEELAKYMVALQCKPHIVSKGKSWVFKTFGEEISKDFKTNRDSYNEFFFKKCICSAIIFRTVDNYLEKNKDSANRPTNFWYKAGGYKGNIIPYTIAKIISLIPKDLSLNWEQIWQRQSLSQAFMREIEKVTKIANDFICDSHGVIVTEYCKQEKTWDKFRDNVQYELSDDFKSELIDLSSLKSQEKSAKSDQKISNDLSIVMNLVGLGAPYWSNILSVAKQHFMVSNLQEQSLNELIKIAKTGNLPLNKAGNIPVKVMKNVKDSIDVKEKLITEGLIKE